MTMSGNPVPPVSGLLPVLLFLLSVPTGGAEKPVLQSEWSKNGTAPIPSRMVKHSAGITSVVLHHTESPNQPPAFERSRLVGIQRYHIEDRGWGDIAYHYLIGPSGTIYEGRDVAWQGDSGTTYDLDGRLLVCLVGNFMEQMPERAAIQALVETVAAQLREHGLEPTDVVTHRMVAATDCPGDTLQAWFEKGGRDAIARAFRGEPYEIAAPPAGMSRPAGEAGRADSVDSPGITVPEGFSEIPSLACAPVSAKPGDVLLDLRYRSPDEDCEFGVMVAQIGHLGSSEYDRLLTWKPMSGGERETSTEKGVADGGGRISERFGISGPGDTYVRYFHRIRGTGDDAVGILWEWMVRDADARKKWAEAYRDFKEAVDIPALKNRSTAKPPNLP